MGMDIGRECFKVSMILDEARQLVVPVQWFYCVEGAKPFPDRHVFGSDQWNQQEQQEDGPGEFLHGPRSHRTGAAPAPFPGTHYHGPLRAFQGGSREDDPTIATTVDGLPLPCLQAVTAFGVLVGGDAGFAWIPHALAMDLDAQGGVELAGLSLFVPADFLTSAARCELGGEPVVYWFDEPPYIDAQGGVELAAPASFLWAPPPPADLLVGGPPAASSSGNLPANAANVSVGYAPGSYASSGNVYTDGPDLTIGGEEPETPSIPTTTDCEGQTVPVYYRVEVAGIANAICSNCGDANGSILLTHTYDSYWAAPECVWLSAGFMVCTLPAQWALRWETGAGVWLLQLEVYVLGLWSALWQGTHATGSAIPHDEPFDQNGSGDPACTSYPSSLEVVPDPGP